METRQEELHIRSLLIDDMRDIYCTVIARTFDDGLRIAIELGPWDELYIDHDLGDEGNRTGYDLLMRLLQSAPCYLPKKIIIVTNNPVGKERMEYVVKEIDAKRKEHEEWKRNVIKKGEKGYW